MTNNITVIFAVNLLLSQLVTYSVPINLNSNWNIGFILGIVLVMQILTGLILSFNYVAIAPEAYYSIAYILEDIHNGYMYRYLHSNGVCMFFMFMYAHLVKGLWYSCTYLPLSWYTGIVILMLSYAIGFMGYVLPYGQMSYWGATVIINLFYWNKGLTELLLGNYSVNSSTLSRFYILHFILPFVVLVVIIVHIYYLHLNSSTNPLSVVDSYSSIRFAPTTLASDIYMMAITAMLIVCQLSYAVITLFTGDSDNSILADPLMTPLHIVPEWYMLPFYGTLKLLPTKLSGLVTMLVFVQTLVQTVEQRNTATVLSLYNVHRTYSYRRVLLIPILVTLGYLGMYHLNLFTTQVGIYVLILYLLIGITSTTCSSTRLQSYRMA
uniref:Cytochrome b n=1 Tax=Babesia microti TaxID=5868 RepID=A0A6G8J3U0_BABMI|nr:cytochrome b [Babesia microti]QIM61715.1 cytochrome b [Babesia microti]QIM61717.1 cytochrome b [Babesia microti]